MAGLPTFSRVRAAPGAGRARDVRRASGFPVFESGFCDTSKGIWKISTSFRQQRHTLRRSCCSFLFVVFATTRTRANVRSALHLPHQHHDEPSDDEHAQHAGWEVARRTAVDQVGSAATSRVARVISTTTPMAILLLVTPSFRRSCTCSGDRFYKDSSRAPESGPGCDRRPPATQVRQNPGWGLVLSASHLRPEMRSHENRRNPRSTRNVWMHHRSEWGWEN